MADVCDEASSVSAMILDGALRPHRERASLQSGDGLCQSCGEQIDPARLAAAPEARRCIDCQRAADRRAR